MKRISSLLIFALLFSVHSLFAQLNNQPQHHILYSHQLDEYRGISVSLPSNYKDDSKSYPILYVLDGEWVFDYATGCVDFLSNDLLGQIPKMIVVGIPNTDRVRDLSVRPDSQATYLNFLDFIEYDLIPFIDKTYRSNGFNIMYGWSSGAAICRELISSRNQLFDGYIESGSGIGDKAFDFMGETVPNNRYRNSYQYVSTEGRSPIRVEGLRKYRLMMESLNPPGLQYKFEVLEKQSHLDGLSQGLYAGLKFIFGYYAIPPSVSKQGAAAIITYFEEINQYYDFPVEVPEGIIHESASLLLQHDKPEETKAILLYGITIYPDSPTLYGKLADLLVRQKDYDNAAHYYQLAIEKSTSNRMLSHKYTALYQRILEKEQHK